MDESIQVVEVKLTANTSRGSKDASIGNFDSKKQREKSRAAVSPENLCVFPRK
ncbi:conserved hypothetical protein [Ricinus communis]|uniref:Uncharacterized protein n=1 Tax=Ricinus communis TaxID=3988 RepID=B9SG83_RICCO|nr:conserved hypothetical protein [Ricinus communis]